MDPLNPVCGRQVKFSFPGFPRGVDMTLGICSLPSHFVPQPALHHLIFSYCWLKPLSKSVVIWIRHTSGWSDSEARNQTCTMPGGQRPLGAEAAKGRGLAIGNLFNPELKLPEGQDQSLWFQVEHPTPSPGPGTGNSLNTYGFH